MGTAARKNPSPSSRARPKLVAVAGGKAQRVGSITVLGMRLRTKKGRLPTKAQQAARLELLELMKSGLKR